MRCFLLILSSKRDAKSCTNYNARLYGGLQHRNIRDTASYQSDEIRDGAVAFRSLGIIDISVNHLMYPVPPRIMTKALLRTLMDCCNTRTLLTSLPGAAGGTCKHRWCVHYHKRRTYNEVSYCIGPGSYRTRVG